MIPRVKMSLRISMAVSALLLAAGVLAAEDANAGVVYNVNGWTPSAFPGAPGTVPGVWVGGTGPATSSNLDTVWYADLSVGSVVTVSSANAVTAGADPAYVLGVGPIGWSGAGGVANQGMGHGAEIGLIHLEDTANLTITMSADSLTPADPSTVIRPGFSLFEGWDTGSTANRLQRFYNDQDNPLGTVGLTYLSGAGAAVGESTITLLFANLVPGDYTLILGGQSSPSGPHGAYSVVFDVEETPLPGTIWLMGSALLGFIGMSRTRRL